MKMYALVWGQDKKIHDTIYLGNFKIDELYEKAEEKVEELKSLDYYRNPFPLISYIEIISGKEFKNMKTSINSIVLQNKDSKRRKNEKEV